MPGFANERLPTIDAGPVRLRWIEDSDVSRLFAVFGDPVVTRFWSAPPLPDENAARLLLGQIRTHYARGDLYQWGVALTATNTLIGTCTLAAIDFEHRRAEAGFALAAEWHGRGLMSRALRALLGVAFRDLALHRVEAEVDPRNLACIRLLERLGFVREGLMRERWRLDGEIQDAVLYGLLSSDPGADSAKGPGSRRSQKPDLPRNP